MTDDRERSAREARRLMDESILIEAGWCNFLIATIKPGADPVQLHDMRVAFFAGAMHLYTSMRAAMYGRGPTADRDDQERVGKVGAELRQFVEDLKINSVPTQGSA